MLEPATRQVFWDDVQEGQEIPPLRKHPSTQQLVQWAAASGDFYQIHYDLDFARSNGLPGLIVQGAFKHAMLGQMLHEWVRYRGSIKRYGVSYRTMDVPGQDLTCRGRVVRKYEKDGENLVDLEIWLENAEAQTTTPGTATVMLPRRGLAGG